MRMAAQLGAHLAGNAVFFAIWSDKARAISVAWCDGERAGHLPLSLHPEVPHTFVGRLEGASEGLQYQLLVDGKAAVDPYARALPDGVHGRAQVVSVPVRRQPKRAVDLDRGEVIYELHVGTFTTEGSFIAATERLAQLRELGVTVVELMPIATFAGARGWGYDGVGLFAPQHAYGTLRDLVALIDTAHGLGMSVVLDVVYNHLGPDGNYLPALSDTYFSRERKNAWGDAPALDQPAFRRLVLDNARYWLEVVGFDGLRLDAAHELEPGGTPHILAELSALAKACSPPAVLIAEDDRNDPKYLFAHGVDAVWSDDFHHSLHVALTAERDGYYSAYQGDLQELAGVIQRGQIYEGQTFPPTGQPRGRPACDVPRQRMIFSLQNHDQVGNRACGERLHDLCGLPSFHAATLLLLFLPATPLLFMGQEWGADSPFLYFTNLNAELGAAVTRGRQDEFVHFAAFRDAGPGSIPDPQSEDSFTRSVLHWLTREALQGRETYQLYRRALSLRRDDPVLKEHPCVTAGVHGRVLWVRAQSATGERLLLLNTGASVPLDEIAGFRLAECELLLASGGDARGHVVFQLEASSAAIFAPVGSRPGAGRSTARELQSRRP